ncbi:MAG TPA: mechanosensitive ion channel family protein, partial [Rectinemataceae bacterium]
MMPPCHQACSAPGMPCYKSSMEEKLKNATRAIADAFSGILAPESLATAITVAFILIFGLGLTRLLVRALRRVSSRALPKASSMILENTIKYGGYAIVILTATRRAGLDISALLGAAGIAGIALGFAAQTSVANIISGLFLFSEQVFKPGDQLQVGEIVGIVESVDLLCVRIRTFDNRLVRVPNETLIKANIINVSHYPTRRLDIWLVLPSKCDFKAALSALKAAVSASPLALEEPEPVLVLDSIGQDGVSVLVGVWFKRENLAALKNQLLPVLLDSLEALGIRPQARRVELSQESAELR